MTDALWWSAGWRRPESLTEYITSDIFGDEIGAGTANLIARDSSAA